MAIDRRTIRGDRLGQLKSKDMIREYILISATTMAMFLAKQPNWGSVPAYETTHQWADGRKVWVYDAALIDSLDLRGWDDLTVQYPLGENDSTHIHIVHLPDNQVIR